MFKNGRMCVCVCDCAYVLLKPGWSRSWHTAAVMRIRMSTWVNFSWHKNNNIEIRSGFISVIVVFVRVCVCVCARENAHLHITASIISHQLLMINPPVKSWRGWMKRRVMRSGWRRKRRKRWRNSCKRRRRVCVQRALAWHSLALPSV